MKSETKSYGIAVSMPDNDPLSAPHLLGSDWSGSRWYDTAAERDAAFNDMNNHPQYYRRGDAPSAILTKIER